MGGRAGALGEETCEVYAERVSVRALCASGQPQCRAGAELREHFLGVCAERHNAERVYEGVAVAWGGWVQVQRQKIEWCVCEPVIITRNRRRSR